MSNLPVIIGVGQVSGAGEKPLSDISPLRLMEEAARAAAADAGASGGVGAVLQQINSVRVQRFFADFSASFPSTFGRMENAPWSLAQCLGLPADELIYDAVGGDATQSAVTAAAAAIAQGKIGAAMVVGAEAMNTERAAKKAKLTLDWSQDAPFKPVEPPAMPPLYSETEIAHGMNAPMVMYAFIDNALRLARDATFDERMGQIGALFAPFAQVAAENPLATRRDGLGADEIGRPSERNQIAAFPYTRLSVANAFVDQSAALILCSEKIADELGVPADKRVYLHAGAAAHDEWFVSHRENLAQSPAIRLIAQRVLADARIGLHEIGAFDLYSCFASAVEVAATEIGLELDDPRGLTVTGGLPFFGGPGNNYVTHAIAQMVERMRQMPGRYGLVTANGGLLTKHAAGVYSTTPPAEMPRYDNHPELQAEVDAVWGEPAPFAATPEGRGWIEAYTVLHGRNGPAKGYVLGRLSNGHRFIALTPEDPDLLARMEAADMSGAAGSVVTDEAGLSRFTPET